MNRFKSLQLFALVAVRATPFAAPICLCRSPLRRLSPLALFRARVSTPVTPLAQALSSLAQALPSRALVRALLSAPLILPAAYIILLTNQAHSTAALPVDNSMTCKNIDSDCPYEGCPPPCPVGGGSGGAGGPGSGPSGGPPIKPTFELHAGGGDGSLNFGGGEEGLKGCPNGLCSNGGSGGGQHTYFSNSDIAAAGLAAGPYGATTDFPIGNQGGGYSYGSGMINADLDAGRLMTRVSRTDMYFEKQGAMPLAPSRTFSNVTAFGNARNLNGNTILGPFWSFNYDMCLEQDTQGTDLILRTGTGSQVPLFKKSLTLWEGDASNGGACRLTKYETTFSLTQSDPGISYMFNLEGQLTRIRTHNGHVQNLTWEDGLLTRVDLDHEDPQKDNDERFITFTYTSYDETDFSDLPGDPPYIRLTEILSPCTQIDGMGRESEHGI